MDTDELLRCHPAQCLSGGMNTPEQVDLGETAKLKVTLGNNHDSTLEVPFRQPIYDFTVSTLDGTEVWRWSDTEDKGDTPAVLRLEPNEWEECEG